MVANMPEHIDPTEGEEDGEGGHKEPKHYSLMAEVGCILGS